MLKKQYVFYIQRILLLLMAMPAYGRTPGEIWVKNQNFISPSFDEQSQKTFNYLGFSLSSDNSADYDYDYDSVLGYDISGQVATNQPVMNYVNPKQFYYKTQNYSVGRKIESWSQADSFFSMGLTNPSFRWNPLDPEEQGLPGAFADFSGEMTRAQSVRLLLWGSPIFIPDQGPGYEIEDNQFKSTNPYFDTPPTTARVFGKILPVKYDLSIPRNEEVVMHPGVGAKIEFKFLENYFVDSFWMYKPSNQLALGVQGKLSTNDYLSAKIYPRIFNHQVFGFEAGFRENRNKIVFGFMHDRSEQAKFDYNEWSAASYGAQSHYSVIGSHDFVYLQVGWGAVSSFGDSREIKGALANKADSLFQERSLYSTAGLARIQSQVYSKGQKTLKLSAKYLEDFDRSFAVTELSSRFSFNRKISATVNLLMARAEQEYGPNHISPFENNDSATVGANYEF